MNKLLTDYLKNYCSLRNPGFAVLIRGKWGTGKTFYIKSFIRDYDSKTKHLTEKGGSHFVYVSLNGAKDPFEIDLRMLSNISPFISNPAFTYIISGIKAASNFEPASKPIIAAISGFFEKTKKKIIGFRLSLLKDSIFVFDDLERSGMSIRDSLAYINMFVEHGSRKVIILANEEEIEKSENATTYATTKEKVIGQTFQVVTNIDSAYDIFTGEIHDENLRNIFLNKREFLIKLSAKLGFTNLRALSQSVKTFEYIYYSVLNKYSQETHLVEEILEIFLYLTVELKSGLLNSENINSAYNIFKFKGMGIADHLKEQESKKKSDREVMGDFFVYSVPFLLHNSWRNIIINGLIDPIAIEKEIEESDYFRNKNRNPLSRFLHDLRSMTNLEFEEVFKQFREGISEGKLTSPGDILHALDMFLLFSEWKVVDESASEIVILFKGIVERYFESSLNSTHDFDYESLDHFGGFSYSRGQSEEFKEIRKLISDIYKQKRAAWVKGHFEALLKKLPDGWGDFLIEFDRFQGKGGRFSGFPVFEWTTPEELLGKLRLIQADNLHGFIEALKERYELNIGNGTFQDIYLSELKFLLKLVYLIQNLSANENRRFNLNLAYIEILGKQILKVLEEITEKYGKKNPEIPDSEHQE